MSGVQKGCYNCGEPATLAVGVMERRLSGPPYDKGNPYVAATQRQRNYCDDCGRPLFDDLLAMIGKTREGVSRGRAR